MPQITPQTRVQIGGDQPVLPTRTQIKAGTSGSYFTNPFTQKDAPAAQSGQNPPSTETPAPKEVTLSPSLTALARRQQKLQSEIEDFKRQQSEFQASKGDFVSKKDFRQRLETQGEDALKDLGLSYEELANILVERQNGADPLKALESKFTEFEKKQAEQTNAQFEATLKQYKAEVSSLIDTDPKAYHLIKKQGLADAVVTHIVESWKENPDEVLSVSQAAKEVEQILREQAKTYAAALAELDPPQDPKQLPPPKSQARTLTPQAEAQPTRSYAQLQHMSPKERLAEAIRRAQKQ